jgi:hypothetical protein
VTGIAGQVYTDASYNGPTGVQKMFASTGAGIYDVS